MPDRRTLLALALPLALAAGAASAQTVPGLEGHAGWLAQRDDVLEAFGAVPAPAVVPPVAAPAEVPDVPPQVVASDSRLALTQVALAAGSTGMVEIAAAQATEGPGAIYLRSGTATLEQLWEATRGTELEAAFLREGEAYRALRPLVVVQGAALQLGRGDVLELDGTTGAFLVNFGRLSIRGATVRATRPAPGAEEDFRPFVASLGTGTLDVAWSVFVGLGSSVAPVASGLSMSAGSLFAGVDQAPSVRDSHFLDVHGVTVLDADGARILGNRFRWSRGVAIRSDDSSRVEIVGNLIEEPDGTFAVRIDGPGGDIRFADNVLLDGSHAGVRIAAGAEGVEVRGNVVSGFAGRGVVAEEGAACLLVAGNLLEGNGGDGFSAQAMGTVLLAGNAVLDNGGAGLSLARAGDEAEVLVMGNLVAGNRSGVRTASIPAMTLSGNDLSNQMPRHLAGDLTQLTPLFLRESRGGARPTLAVDLVRAEVTAPPPPEAAEEAFAACRAGGRS